MPQMKLLLWLNLYIYTLILFMISLVLINYFYLSFKLKDNKNLKKKMNNFLWLL
nr:ATP synthase F0 subunit 8 [Kradibia gibbosae]